jgi:heptosyltransferase-2
VSKTLVIQPLPGIGDMVWHLPHLQSIAAQAPGGTIAVLTKRRSLADQLFDGVNWVFDVHWLERAQGPEPAGRHDGILGATRLARDLRRLRVETVWILHHSWRYAAAARLAGIASRIGYRELPTQSRQLHQAEKATELLRVHGLTVDPTPRYTPTDRARAEIDRLYGDLPRPWLVLGIGASEEFKLWPEERFAALARAYRDRTGGTVILAGGPDDKGPAERIMMGTKGAAVLALGRPLGQAAALAGMADAVVGNDSGLLNLAAATGTRCIGLFGGSEPLTLYPNLEALQPEGGAVYRENRMDGIEVESVMQALSRALARSNRDD